MGYRGIPIFMACDKYCYFFLLRSVHTWRQVAATSRGNRSLCVQVRRLVAATRYGDMSQRQIASCVQENFCENLCLCNRVLSQQQVTQILSDLIFCDLLQRQNYVAETKIFTKFSSTHEAICRCDVSLQRVAATCRQVCTLVFKH